MHINYVDELTKSKAVLQQLKQEFNYVKPNDQFLLTIERLLKHIEQLLDVCASSSDSMTPELLRADAEYFKLNTEGLRKVLDAFRK